MDSMQNGKLLYNKLIRFVEYNMTRKNSIFLNIRRILYLLFAIACFAFVFVFIDSDLLVCIFFILSLLAVCFFMFSFVIKTKRKFYIIEKYAYLYPLTIDEIIKEYHFYGLESLSSKVLKLYFNNDGTKRCLVVQESNAVKIIFQKLNYYDDEEKIWAYRFATWQDEYLTDLSYYGSAELAVNDNKNFLKDYHEEKYAQQLKDKFNAEIEWSKIDYQSKIIRFGINAEFYIEIDGEKYLSLLYITDWLNEKYCRATILLNKNAVKNRKKFKFNIYYDNKVIGFGYYNQK